MKTLQIFLLARKSNMQSKIVFRKLLCDNDIKSKLLIVNIHSLSLTGIQIDYLLQTCSCNTAPSIIMMK